MEPIIPQGCTHNSECLKEYGQIDYIPSLGGNAFYLGWFIVALLVQVALGVKFRTWGFMAAMIGGTGLEIVGYIGRIMLHNDIFDNNSFIIYLVGVTIAPAFFSAAIYLSISRIISVYGEKLSLLKPRTITIIFIGGDLMSLIMQSAGGAIASTSDTEETSDIGINIMIAGLATQVAATTAFGCLYLHLMWAVRRYPHKVLQETKEFRSQFRVQAFVYGIGIATLAILIRCVFRCAELSEGFQGHLANDEPTFMILDGALMALTVFLLTAAHPGPTFGSRWDTGAFWGKKKNSYALTSSKEDRGSRGGSSENFGVV